MVLAKVPVDFCPNNCLTQHLLTRPLAPSLSQPLRPANHQKNLQQNLQVWLQDDPKLIPNLRFRQPASPFSILFFILVYVHWFGVRCVDLCVPFTFPNKGRYQ